MPRSDSTPWGPLSADILRCVLAHLDLQTLVTAETVSRAWRTLIQDETPLWRKHYLAFDEVDMTVKWRLLALDGRGPPVPGSTPSEDADADAPANSAMAPGDGRGVSGPPADTATLYMMALRSSWAAEFERDVIAKLAADDPIRARIFDKDKQVKTPQLPRASDLVYQWGTHLERPDWRQHCLRQIQRNACGVPFAGSVVSTITVPLRLPVEYRQLSFRGEDAGDDALLFTAVKVTDSRERLNAVLICVERANGNVRYIADLLDDLSISVEKDIGLFGQHRDSRTKRVDTYLSGRALNNLCKDMSGTCLDAGATFHRGGHVQPLGSCYPLGGAFYAGLDNCGDHLEIAMVRRSAQTLRPQWDTVTGHTFAKELWDVSAPSVPDGWATFHPTFTENYVFVTDNFGDGSTLHIYCRRTGEHLVSLLRSFNDRLVSFVFELSEDGESGADPHPEDEFRPITLSSVGCQSPIYSAFLAQMENEGDIEDNPDGGRDYSVWRVQAMRRGAAILNVAGGFIAIPHVQTVLDGARAVSPAERHAYIAERSILILTPNLKLTSFARDVLQLKTLAPTQQGTTYFLNLRTLPIISPSMSAPVISGYAVRRASPDGWCAGPLHLIGDGGSTLEIMRPRVPDDKFEYLWGEDTARDVRMMLRITTFAARV